MKIGIDARFYRAPGLGRYTRNLLDQLQKLDKKNDYFVFLLPEDYSSVELSDNFHKVLADFPWYGVQEQVKFPPLLNTYKLDLVHFPHFNIPIFYRGKFVVTVHDFIHHDFKMKRATTHSNLVYELKHHVHKYVINQALHRSKKIITVSEFVKNQMMNKWGVNTEKIIVTYEAAGDNLLHLSKTLSEKQTNEILHDLNVKPPFIFYIGSAHPHKNIEGFIKAFLKLHQKYQDLQLVLAGNDPYFWKRMREEFHHPDILFLGFITDEQLVALYKRAQGYIFPSFAEGFGLPLLEAMAMGTPVVSSNATSLPEIGGDAALYFDPYNVDDMVEKISHILNDQKLRKSLIEKGSKRYQKFSWEKLGKETLRIYESI